MRVRHSLIVKSSDDADGKNVLFYTDPTLAETVVDAYQHTVSGRLTIPLNTTLALNLDSLTAVRGAYITVDNAASISVNCGTAIVMAPATTLLKAKFFIEGVITSISIISPVLSATQVVYALYGDLVV